MRKFVRSNIVATAAAAAVGFAGSAFAADMPVKARLAAPASYTWNGWYVGFNAGYGFSSSTASFAGLDPGGAARLVFIQPGSESRKGVLAGLQLGVNYQTGNLVYGLETDFDGGQINGSSTGPLVPVILPVGEITTTETKLNWFGTARGRLGITAFERSLLYATGGLAYGRATSSVNATIVNNGACTSVGNLCFAGSAQKWKLGWTIGAGWEYAFGEKWSAKVEYLYYDLGTIKNTLTPMNGLAGITIESSAKISGNIVRVGLNYKLN